MSGIATSLTTRYALAVDLGTGGPKIGFVSLAGELAWEEHVRVETRWSPGGGAAQDAGDWWRVVRLAAGRGLRSGAFDPAAVVAVGITGLWASTVPVGEDGEPVGEALLWMDSRGGRFSRDVIAGPVAGYAPRPALQWIRRSGGAPSTSGADPIGHMLYLLHERPEIYRRARWLMEPIDYLAMCFTGVPAASHASMTAAWLTDNRRLDHLGYDPVLLRLSGLDDEKLPPLRPTGSVVGEVCDSVARELGLPAGVQVVTPVPDLHSAACGSGAVLDYATHLAISTSAWIGAPVPFKKTDAIRQVASVPGLSPDRYIIANNHETGGLSLEWMRDAVARESTLDELVAEAESSAPGAGSVIFTPWLNGERSPVDDRRARGGFHNMSVSTSRADLVRAVLEGVAYNNRWLHDAVERFAQRRLDPLRIIGGGAQSDLWCQIHANVMDRTVERVSRPRHANLRGAAIFCSMALGVVNRDDVRGLVTVDRTFEPDPATRNAYDRLFGEFRRLYARQKAMFKRLNS